jgi:hypothetical protein
MPTARRAHPGAGLAQCRLGVGEQHVAPARQHAVELRGRQVDPLGVHRAELGVGDPELSRAGTREVDHLLDGVRAQERPAGEDELGGEEPGVARTRGELEHPVAGLRLDRVDEPRGNRPPGGLQAFPMRAPAVRGTRPPLEARAAVRGGLVAHQPVSVNLTTRRALPAEFPNEPTPSVP